MHDTARDSERNKQAMTHSVFRHDEHEPHDDMTAEALAIISISLAATYLSAGGDPSLVCIPGSMVAALVALLKSTQEKRDWTEKAANSIGISAVGSTAPSALAYWLWPETAGKFMWQAWALLGFMGGLLGWSLAYAFVKVFNLRSDRFATRWARRWERRIAPDDDQQQSENPREDERQ